MKRPRFILTCKQVSRTLLEDHYQELPWHRKLAVRFHLSWCWICGRFNKQVIIMQNGVDTLVSHESDDPVPPELRLPEDSRGRILEALREKKN